MMLSQPETKLRIRKGAVSKSRMPLAISGLFGFGQPDLQNSFDVYQLLAIAVRPMEAEPEP